MDDQLYYLYQSIPNLHSYFYMVVVFRILTYILLHFCFYKCYGLEVLVLTLSTLQISYLDIVVSTN